MTLRTRTCQLAMRPESCKASPVSHNLKSFSDLSMLCLKNICFSVFARARKYAFPTC